MRTNLIMVEIMFLSCWFSSPFCLGCSHGDPCDKTEKTTDAYGPKVNISSMVCIFIN